MHPQTSFITLLPCPLQVVLGINRSIIIPMGHANETPRKPKTSRISRETLLRLARTQYYDLQLYAFARKLQALRHRQGTEQARLPGQTGVAGGAAGAGPLYAQTRRRAGLA